MARAPPARPGCVVTSLTRSPLIQTSRCCSRSPFRYWRPVRAGMVRLLWLAATLPRRQGRLPVGTEPGELVGDALDIGQDLAPDANRSVGRKLQVDRISHAAKALFDGGGNFGVSAAGREDTDDVVSDLRPHLGPAAFHRHAVQLQAKILQTMQRKDRHVGARRAVEADAAADDLHPCGNCRAIRARDDKAAAVDVEVVPVSVAALHANSNLR